MIKIILYTITIPIIIYTVTSLNLEKYFKKNSTNQIKMFYLIISLVLSFLIVSFLIDFYETTRILN